MYRIPLTPHFSIGTTRTTCTARTTCSTRMSTTLPRYPAIWSPAALQLPDPIMLLVLRSQRVIPLSAPSPCSSGVTGEGGYKGRYGRGGRGGRDYQLLADPDLLPEDDADAATAPEAEAEADEAAVGVHCHLIMGDW